MKKFFSEFKTFITRGNVMDMAVGVIVGGAFTAIVTALTANILQPLINWMLALIVGGEDALASAVTMLQTATDATGAVDMANSIYINWGAFISAVINFILVAFVLFSIVKIINKLDANAKALKQTSQALTKEEKKQLRKEGKSRKEIFAIEEEKLAEAKRLAEELAAASAKPTTDEILTEILETLKNK